MGTQQVLDYYKDVLKFCEIKVGKDHKLYDTSSDKSIPILINEKEVVLPYDEVLRSDLVKSCHIFHLMPENIARGESIELTKLKQYINTKVNLKSYFLIQMLIEVLSNNKFQTMLDSDQAEFISRIGTLDKTGTKHLLSYTGEKYKSNFDSAMANIFIKKGGFIGKERYNRVATISYPLMISVLEQSPTKVQMREKDYIILANIVRAIFPDCEDKELNMFGSRNGMVPSLDVLLRASYKLACNINDIHSVFESMLEETSMEFEPFDTSFYDQITALEDLANDAARIPTTFQEEVAPAMPKPSPMVQPTQAPRPANGDTVDFMQVVQSNPAMYMGMMGNQFGGMPGMFNQQPMIDRNNPTWRNNYMPPVPQYNPYGGVPGMMNQQPMGQPMQQMQPVPNQQFFNPAFNQQPTEYATPVRGKAPF